MYNLYYGKNLLIYDLPESLKMSLYYNRYCIQIVYLKNEIYKKFVSFAK